MYTAIAVTEQPEVANVGIARDKKLVGGDASRGNTRSHPEHDG